MSVILSAQSLSKSFAHRHLFRDLNFDLRIGEKVGLIGPNGAGKSTLLKLLVGLETPDSGVVSTRRGSRIGYVPQDDLFPEGQTARQVLLQAQESDSAEEYERETQAAIVLTQVGMADPDVRADTLSGGWRKRLSLARALVTKPDFLLMDEPTNHLDVPGIVWLEQFLRKASFGYLIATHDRAFLRSVAEQILEVDRLYPDGVFRATCTYEEFAERRAEFLETQLRQRDSVANQVRRETDWLGRKAAARTRKARSRIEAAYDRREELADLTERTNSAQAAAIDFAGTGRQTRKLLVAEGLAKSLGGRELFGDVSTILSPGMKLGLLGTNGSGKSTLLKVLSGLLQPDRGTLQYAEQLRIESFEQGRTSLDLSQTLRQAISPHNDMVVFRDQQLHVASWAKRFLFEAEQLNVELSALSGGEQARVRIAQLMLRPADLLLLDEPTNDLDIPALEVLEESLADFPGAIVIVSHDREFLDRLCTDVIGFDDRGGAAPYGSVGQWLTAYQAAQAALAKASTSKTPETRKSATPTKTKKLTFQEQREWDGMEAAILTAEQQVAVCETAVQTAATGGPGSLQEACVALAESQKRVEQLYARWQELDAKRQSLS